MSPPDRGSIEAKLERFIVAELLEEGYDGRDPLATGAVDSLGIEQLVGYIEEEYEVTFHDEEMIEENFESIAGLATLVATKTSEVGA